MIANDFSDNGKPIFDKREQMVFYYIFSSDAHIINESPNDYEYATDDQINLIEKHGIKEFGRRVYRFIPRSW